MTTPKKIPEKSVPWWLSLLAAVLSYVLLKYIAPLLAPDHPFLYRLCSAGPDFAPIVAIPFLLLAAKQLYDGAPSEDDGPGPGDDSPPPDPDN
jgi:hypothetical protein